MSKSPGHPSERWSEVWRLHDDLPPAAAALLRGAALDMEPGPVREAMEALADLLEAHRTWLGLYTKAGRVVADVQAADQHGEEVERFETLWQDCEAEAEAALAPYLPPLRRAGPPGQ